MHVTCQSELDFDKYKFMVCNHNANISKEYTCGEDVKEFGFYL